MHPVRALRWLQLTLVHLMFKCKTSYAIVFFTFLIKLVRLITCCLPVFPGLWGMMQPPPP